MAPTREELAAALKVFAGWLAEEAATAERDVAARYVAGQTTPEQTAERVGVARGLSAAAGVLQARLKTA